MKATKCSGKGLINPNSMGGHIEDYTIESDSRRQAIPYPPKMEWVPVGESFKKSK